MFFADFCSNVVSSFTALGVPILCWGVLCYHKPHLSPPSPPSLSLWPHLQTFYLTAHLFLTYTKIWAILQSTYHSLIPTHLVPQPCWAGQSYSRGRHCKAKKVMLYTIYISAANGSEIIWNKELSFKSVRSKQQKQQAWSNASASNVKNLQLPQNFARKIVAHSRKYNHATLLFHQPSWLPVKLCQTAFISERLSYSIQVCKQPRSYLFKWHPKAWLPASVIPLKFHCLDR